MKRITPEEVVDAYIATGCFVSKGTYHTRDFCGACALGAVFLARFPLTNVGDYLHVACKLEYDVHYCKQFSNGFEEDGRPVGSNGGQIGPIHRESLGYLDGIAARDSVQAHFAAAKEKAQPVEEELVGA